MGVPHPFNGIADRIAALESRALVTGAIVWMPQESISGAYEAAGEDWEITEPDPVTFADKLEAQLPAK